MRPCAPVIAASSSATIAGHRPPMLGTVALGVLAPRAPRTRGVAPGRHADRVHAERPQAAEVLARVVADVDDVGGAQRSRRIISSNTRTDGLRLWMP